MPEKETGRSVNKSPMKVSEDLKPEQDPTSSMYEHKFISTKSNFIQGKDLNPGYAASRLVETGNNFSGHTRLSKVP